VRLYQQANTGWNVAEVEVYGAEYAAVAPGGLAGDVSANYLVNENYARDGNTDTRANIVGCPCIGSWVALDLGAVLPITQVQAFFKDGTFSGRVEYSVDGSSWTTAQSINPTNGVWQTYAVSFTARYVRLYQTGNFGWTLGEFEVYGLLPTPTPVPTATPVVTAPVASTSIYVTSQHLDDTYFQDWGCKEATKNVSADGPHNAIVVLNFGQPWQIPQSNINQSLSSTYGTRVWREGDSLNHKYISIERIEQFVQQYLTSYWNCANTSSTQTNLSLAVGLNNDSYDYFVTVAHGQEWGKMITRLNKWIGGHFCEVDGDPRTQEICRFRDRESVFGAVDIEDWVNLEKLPTRSPQPMRRWIQGYNLETHLRYYNFGNCNCPFSGVLQPAPYNVASQNGSIIWTYDDYIEFSQNYLTHAYPLPEIYSLPDNPYDALRWRLLSDYSATYGIGPILIDKLATQSQACNCGSGTNTPFQAWQQVVEQFQDYQGEPQWITDFVWAYQY
jgi:hypothetical protein